MDKQTQILEKAEELFAEKGFDGTSVRDIAEYAGVNLAMISYYFGSKEKLLEAIFNHRMSATRSRLEDIFGNKSLGFSQKMDLMIDEYINKVMTKQCFYRVLYQAQIINKNKEVIRLINEYRLGYAKLISEIMEEGKKEKKIKKETDVVLLLATMAGTVTQMLINKDYYRQFDNKEQLSEEAFDEQLKDKLSAHIKQLFKATMGYE